LKPVPSADRERPRALHAGISREGLKRLELVLGLVCSFHVRISREGLKPEDSVGYLLRDLGLAISGILRISREGLKPEDSERACGYLSRFGESQEKD